MIIFSRNKDLYKFLNRNDDFSDRLTILLVHFCFFLKRFKSEENRKIMQEIYDFVFRQLELSIREEGYGDQSINKKMKVYLNYFHSVVDELHFWEKMEFNTKVEKLSIFLSEFKEIKFFVEYFDDFYDNLQKNNLKYYLNSVIKP